MALAAIFIIQASKPTFYRKNTILTEIYSIQGRIQGGNKGIKPHLKNLEFIFKKF